MLRRIIIISSGALLSSFCVATAILTLLGKNPATLHLSKFFLIGYAAITAVLTPFGISGVIGGSSRKKALIRTFVTFHWWTSTFILIGLNAANVILGKKDRGDFIRKCQADLAKGQPDTNFLARCITLANNNEKFTLIATFTVGGIMLFLGIILLIVGTREYSFIRSEEEVKNLLEKSSKTDTIEEIIYPDTTSSNDGGAIDPYETRFNMNNVTRQPPNAVTTNVDLIRRPTNMNGQYIRQPTSPRNQEFMTPPYQGLTRNPTIPVAPRYPMVNVTRQQTIGNAYAPRNYVGARQQTYPMVPQRSLSTKQYIEPPQPSYVTQIVIPPPQPVISEINNNNDYYIRKPYKNTTPYIAKTAGMN